MKLKLTQSWVKCFEKSSQGTKNIIGSRNLLYKAREALSEEVT